MLSKNTFEYVHSFSNSNCICSSNFPISFLEMVALLLRKKSSNDMTTLLHVLHLYPVSSSSDLRACDDVPIRVVAKNKMEIHSLILPGRTVHNKNVTDKTFLFQWCHSCDIQVAFQFSKLILNYAARGVVEIARYIFSVAGVEYEDYRYPIEDYGPPPKFSAVKRNMHFTLRRKIIDTFACRRFLRTNTAGNWRLQWAR